jgi:hypothetical protein
MNKIKKVTTLGSMTYLYSSGNKILLYNYNIEGTFYRIKRIIGRNRFGIGFIKYGKNTKN